VLGILCIWNFVTKELCYLGILLLGTLCVRNFVIRNFVIRNFVPAPWFRSGFPSFSFTVYNTELNCRNYERLQLSLKKYKSQGKSLEVTVSSKAENS
jgi:hypothetical protein